MKAMQSVTSWPCEKCGKYHESVYAAALCCSPAKHPALGARNASWADTDQNLSAEGIDATLAERGRRYGDFREHAAVAQRLQDGMRQCGEGWQKLDPVKRQALTVIADKIARILSGDPEYRDNWHDIQGYAKLAEDRCVADGQADLPLG